MTEIAKTSAPLPSFARPPVTEVVLSMQFNELRFKSFHSGLLAKRLPQVEEILEQEPLVPTFEVFGNPLSSQPAMEFQFGLPSLRYWYKARKGTEITQVQANRLLCNWVKTPQNNEYPRFHSVRDAFLEKHRIFVEFARELKLGEVVPNQCEVTYINKIELPDGESPHSQLDRIFRFWSNEYKDDQGRKVEDATVAFRYVLHGEDGSPIGRLFATARPMFRNSDGKPAIHLDLTARGKLESPDLAGALKFFDFGHEAIVRAFASMTRDEMHTFWGRE